MKIWETLVGVREDLPSLRQKWWHKLWILFWFASSVIVFFISVVVMSVEPIRPTTENIFSLSLMTFARGRPGSLTLLTELSALPGALATLGPNGQLEPLVLLPPSENIRCEAPPKFKARQTFVEKDSKTGAALRFTAIPDYVGQRDGELRYCAASPGYAAMVSQQVVNYRLDGAVRRWRSGRTAAKALGVAVIWLVVCLNFYYRGMISIYAARRKRRIRSAAHSR